MRLRRIELVCGVLGGVLGLAALAVSLFAPLAIECSTSATGSSVTNGCTHVSVAETQGLASLWFAIALFSGLSLAVLLFALWHSLAPSLPALILLWVAVGLLCLLTVVALLSIGPLFLPADVLAVTAAVVGTRAAMLPIPAHA